MTAFNVEEFFDAILPTVQLFGDIAYVRQFAVEPLYKGKACDNEALRVYTEEDLIVQNGIARDLELLLDRFTFSFLPEEDSPINDRFPKNERVLVVLDPIDGTLAYINQKDVFCQVLSVYVDYRLEGTMVYTPVFKKTYCATQEKAWNEDKKELIIPEGNNKVLTIDLPEEICAALERRGLQILEFGTPKMDKNLEINSIYRGDIGGYFKKDAPCFDWWPIALPVEKAGHAVTDFQGRPLSHRYKCDQIPHIPSVIAATNPVVHKILVEILSQW